MDWGTARFVECADVKGRAVKLWLRESGRVDAPPLLLLHGLGITGLTWKWVAEELGGRFRLLAPDLPGFGRSDKPSFLDATGEGVAAVVVGLLDALGLPSVTLVGHSMGGGISLATAVLHPKRVSGLVLMGAAALDQPVPPAIRYARLPLAAWAIRLMPPAWLALGYLDAYHRPQRDTRDVVRAYVSSLRSGRGPEGYVRAARALRYDRFRTIAERIPSVCCPTLLLHGARDRVVPPWVPERLSHEIPQARLTLLPEVGHMPQEETPSEVARLLSAWSACIPCEP
ncbi:MAG TPA: alpha/beta fold hydrolase [Armatimonadota bacterium]|jgi:pimeloyl-ACP methyl ester carboxylesterase